MGRLTLDSVDKPCSVELCFMASFRNIPSNSCQPWKYSIAVDQCVHLSSVLSCFEHVSIQFINSLILLNTWPTRVNKTGSGRLYLATEECIMTSKRSGQVLPNWIQFLNLSILEVMDLHLTKRHNLIQHSSPGFSVQIEHTGVSLKTESPN